ncbi:PREDICTED: uncharacterized protein LOC109233621 [Nicotiana attenuata]|uniref:uncharacterized protein LOC109233621 n=1 Tax=Nicotiana attenuata TaxID=49451 RepID=UPI00090566E7|nr:PREDICTED: uncharacterized protein LOC109233621 [Nicotiana attenuata]
MGTQIHSQEATLTSTAIWIRLPQLPTEFYDKGILEKVGRKLGKLLKIDQCTSSTLRGHYARICIQVPLETPVETSVIIEDHKQAVIYEREGTMCTYCGRIGHTSVGCNYRPSTPKATQETQETQRRNVAQSEESEWKTVTFPRRRKQGLAKSNNKNDTGLNNPHQAPQADHIQVNLFDANSGKFLQTQSVRYNSKKVNPTPNSKNRLNGPINNASPSQPQRLTQQRSQPSKGTQPSTSAKRKAGSGPDDSTDPNHEVLVQGATLSPTTEVSHLKDDEKTNGASLSSPNGYHSEMEIVSPSNPPNTLTYASSTNSSETISNGEISTVTTINQVPYLVPLPIPDEKTQTVNSNRSTINDQSTPSSDYQ